MKNKNIIIFVLVVAGMVGLMWWGKSVQKPVSANLGQNSNYLKGVLIAAETLYNFGTIRMADGNVSTIFKITNPTDKDVNLASIVTSCMCTVAYIESKNGEKGPFGMPGHGGPVARADEIIKAGESRGVKVVYDPNAHGPAGIGPVDRFITLTDADGGVLQLVIKALVRP